MKLFERVRPPLAEYWTPCEKADCPEPSWLTPGAESATL
jgi:hypothetical protein